MIALTFYWNARLIWKICKYLFHDMFWIYKFRCYLLFSKLKFSILVLDLFTRCFYLSLCRFCVSYIPEKSLTGSYVTITAWEPQPNWSMCAHARTWMSRTCVIFDFENSSRIYTWLGVNTFTADNVYLRDWEVKS